MNFLSGARASILVILTVLDANIAERLVKIKFKKMFRLDFGHLFWLSKKVDILTQKNNGILLEKLTMTAFDSYSKNGNWMQIK